MTTANIQINDDKILLRHEGASAEIYLFGAHVTSWKASRERGGDVAERFFMSETAVLDGTGPIRGGIPIAFPIFATDTHPDYEQLGGAHGFARISKWTVSEKTEQPGFTSVTLSLSSHDSINTFDFKPSFRLDYTVRLEKHTLLTTLKVANTSNGPFRFNTCLHTYYAVPDVAKAIITPLDELRFTSRLDPSSKHDLRSRKDVTLTEETARCYHLPKGDNKVTVQYDQSSAEGVEIVCTGGWEDSVLWNPGQKTGDAIPDLHVSGYKNFVCWEPGVIQSLTTLAPGGVWTGAQSCKAI